MVTGRTGWTRKAIFVAVVVCAVLAFYGFGLNRYLSFAGLKAGHSELLALYVSYPAQFIITFVLIQVCALALCLPGAVLSPALAGGAIFGPEWGTVIVLGSITLGDSLGFLVARHLLRDWVKRRFGKWLGPVDAGVERDGAFYLLGLRLMAAIPFFVVNVSMALTQMRLRVFAPVSLIGLVPATALYVNAGTALADIETPGDILTLRIVLSLAALGLFPVVARLLYNAYQARRSGLPI